MKHIIVDNFFDNFNYIENSFKEIKMYDKKEYISKFKANEENWPGKRSYVLNSENAFLFNLFIKEFDIKFSNPFNGIPTNIKSHIHLRTKKDEIEDFIHRDISSCNYTCLIFLSKTNLNSGTNIYSENKEIITSIKFVQNRAILFDSNYLHSAFGHYGDDVNDGRLTLNAFFKFQ
jgi:hypothetical protein